MAGTVDGGGTLAPMVVTAGKAEMEEIQRPTTAVVVMAGKGAMAESGVVTAAMEEIAPTVTPVTVVKAETGLGIQRVGTAVMVVIQKLIKVATAGGAVIQMVMDARETVVMVALGILGVDREVSRVQPMIATGNEESQVNDSKKV